MGWHDGMLIKPNRLLCQWRTFKGPLKKKRKEKKWTGTTIYIFFFAMQLLHLKMRNFYSRRGLSSNLKEKQKIKELIVTATAESCINLCVSGEKSDTLNSVSVPCQKNSKLKSGQLSSGLLLNCSLDGGDIIFFSIGVSHQVPKQSDQLYSKCVLIHLGPSRLQPPS